MPSEALRLGDLPLLRERGVEVPPDIGRLKVRIVNPTYGHPDEHFRAGIGVETVKPIPVEILRDLRSDPSAAAVVRTILDCYAALHVACPALRQKPLDGMHVLEQRSIQPFAPDKKANVSSDVLLTGRSNGAWPMGETMICTNRVFVGLLIQHGREIGWNPEMYEGLYEFINEHREYGDERAMRDVMGLMDMNFHGIGSQGQHHFLDRIRGRKDCVLLHDWTKHEALFFSRQRSVRMTAADASGQLEQRSVAGVAA